MQEQDTSGRQRWWEQVSKYSRLLALGGIGVVLMLIAPLWDEADRRADTKTETVHEIVPTSPSEEWEDRLEKILSQVEGVGDVTVLVRMDEKSAEHEKNRTIERRYAVQGGEPTEERVTEEVIMQRHDGKELPIVKRQYAPRIAGVIVAAQGASSSEVRKKIQDAVCAVTGTTVHRVKILTKTRGDRR